MSASQQDLPRCGGIVEDETGAWRIVEVRADEGGVMLEDHHGERVWRRFGNLGAVHYEPEDRVPDGEWFEGDGSNYAEAEDY